MRDKRDKAGSVRLSIGRANAARRALSDNRPRPHGLPPVDPIREGMASGVLALEILVEMVEKRNALLGEVLAVLDASGEFQCGPKGKHLALREAIRKAITKATTITKAGNQIRCPVCHDFVRVTKLGYVYAHRQVLSGHFGRTLSRSNCPASGRAPPSGV